MSQRTLLTIIVVVALTPVAVVALLLWAMMPTPSRATEPGDRAFTEKLVLSDIDTPMTKLVRGEWDTVCWFGDYGEIYGSVEQNLCMSGRERDLNARRSVVPDEYIGEGDAGLAFIAGERIVASYIHRYGEFTIAVQNSCASRRARVRYCPAVGSYPSAYTVLDPGETCPTLRYIEQQRVIGGSEAWKRRVNQCHSPL